MPEGSLLTKYRPTICPTVSLLGREWTRMDPKTGTQAARIVTRQRWLTHFAAIIENRTADKVDIIPVGMFKRELSIAEKPKLLIMIPPKVVRPSKMHPISKIRSIISRVKPD